MTENDQYAVGKKDVYVLHIFANLRSLLSYLAITVTVQTTKMRGLIIVKMYDAKLLVYINSEATSKALIESGESQKTHHRGTPKQ